MDDSTVEVDERRCDIRQDATHRVAVEAGSGLYVVAQTLLGARHNQHPVALELAVIDNRDDVPGITQPDEKQLSISTGRLGNQLGDGFLVASVGDPRRTEATGPDLLA